MDVNVKVDGTALDALMHKAVLEAIGQEGQAQIIREAVKYLTTKPPNNNYGRNESSPLMRLVECAAENIARVALKDKLEHDADFVAQVNSLYAEAASRIFGTDTREKLVGKLAESMSHAISSER